MARILALVSFKIFPPHMGGQKHVVLFYEHLVQHHDVLMLASADNIDPIVSDFPVRTILLPNRKMMSNLSLLGKIKKIIKEEKIDCIITEHSYTGWLGYLLRKRTGVPFIIHSHNLEVYRFRQMNRKGWRFYKPYERWIHQAANHNFFISNEDRDIAIKDFRLKENHCTVAPYGIEKTEIIEKAKEKFSAKYKIDNSYIFHFNGTMDYTPNMDAVDHIIDHLDPLLAKTGLDYKIVITGKRLDAQIQQKIKTCSGIVYLDFIEDINLMYQASDVFINTVVNNSGVKTKVIEALANHCTVVSTRSGAAGIPKEITADKLRIAADHDWEAFCREVVAAVDKNLQTPAAFFEYFSWEKIASNASGIINQVIRKHAR
jgi:hypothetical protein